VNAIAGVDPRLLWWRPAEDADHIGFLVWHMLRDEDTVVSDLGEVNCIRGLRGWHGPE